MCSPQACTGPGTKPTLSRQYRGSDHEMMPRDGVAVMLFRFLDSPIPNEVSAKCAALPRSVLLGTAVEVMIMLIG